MNLNELVIENFGPFRERTVFDLRTTAKNKKTIVLFGGKNGAGKTTIFDAVRLCLYGRHYNGRDTSTYSYSDYIKNRIHKSKNSEEQDTTASVELSFEQTTFQSSEQYRILRSWDTSSNGELSEKLSILKNGQVLSDIDTEGWQNFVKEILPPGITDLFFFDGEKIQHLADDKNNFELSEAVNMLLGLDLVEKLKADLGIYKSKHLAETTKRDAKEELTKFKEEEKKFQEQIEMLFEETASLETRKRLRMNEIEKQENEISTESGGYAIRRDGLKDRIGRIFSDTSIFENELRMKAADLIPFVFVPNLCKSLAKRIITEATTEEERTFKSKISKRMEKLKEAQVKKKFIELGVPEDKLNKFFVLLRESLMPEQTQTNLVDKTYTSNLTYQDRQRILNAIERSQTSERDSLSILSKKIEALYSERLDLEKALNKVPSDEVLAPMLSRLSELNQELGKINEKIRHLTVEKDSVKYKLLVNLRNLKRLEEGIENSKNADLVLQRINTATQLLDKYSVELKRKKLEILEKHLLECFTLLHRKKDYLEKITINENDFSVMLFLHGGKKIPKDRLSAGEKQIFAMALLWALTNISNRRLPFIIDTPLGRLDSEHRTNIVERFFPNASSQVIILSTDTEITNNHFNEIKNRIKRSYHLTYSGAAGVTEVKDGYFWSG